MWTHQDEQTKENCVYSVRFAEVLDGFSVSWLTVSLVIITAFHSDHFK